MWSQNCFKVILELSQFQKLSQRVVLQRGPTQSPGEKQQRLSEPWCAFSLAPPCKQNWIRNVQLLSHFFSNESPCSLNLVSWNGNATVSWFVDTGPVSSLIQCLTGRVFQYQVGSGRVLEKILSSRSGSGGVGELKYTIRHSQASFLLSGRYSWLFPGILGY